MSKLYIVIVFFSLALAQDESQSLFDQYIQEKCPNWEIEVQKGQDCCCYDFPNENDVICADSHTNFFTNQETCRWDGTYSENLLEPSGNCVDDLTIYKQVYSDTIQCHQNAAQFANGNDDLLPTYTKENDMDTLWILLGGFLVFFMQTGFAALEVGSTKSRNAQNILLKNMVDNCAGSLIWWLVGYAFAYGEDLFGIGFIGGKNGYFFAGNHFDDTPNSYRDCFFQLAFATTSATIVSGALAGRTHFWAYFTFSCITTSIIYPVIVHWTWGGGWLGSDGYYDFAGSGIVHMVGGLCGLIGAIAAKPRLGRFAEGGERKFRAHNVPLIVLGTLILWFGWFGFNAGSTLSMSGENVTIAAYVSINTMIAASSGGIMTFIMKSKFLGKGRHNYNIGAMCNGILAGLVAITAPCGNVSSQNAFFIGMIGGASYDIFSRTVLWLKIDDPLDAFAVHYGGGIAGVLCVGLFDMSTGLFYGEGLRQLWVQFYSAIMITVWTGFWASVAFFSMRGLKLLRISKSEEVIGLDEAECGGQAYEIENMNFLQYGSVASEPRLEQELKVLDNELNDVKNLENKEKENPKKKD